MDFDSSLALAMTAQPKRAEAEHKPKATRMKKAKEQ